MTNTFKLLKLLRLGQGWSHLRVGLYVSFGHYQQIIYLPVLRLE